MNKVPVVFCFDDNLSLAAGVCISSLLTHAHEGTFYDIFIVHDKGCLFPKSGFLEKLNERFDNFNLTYKRVDAEFNTAYEIRGINSSTYYRLLIPELITEYNVVMYHDIDVIFRDDLSEIYRQTDMTGYYIAGVVSSECLDPVVHRKRQEMGLIPTDYILAGDIIINAKTMHDDGIVEKFRKEAQHEYEFQDMDIINIVCKGKIKRLPPAFCGTVEIFKIASYNEQQNLYSDEELKAVLDNGIVHYNGRKPWDGWCPNMDIWWEYYRNSVFYDPGYYFKFFYSKLNEYDNLPFWKRIKILLRYFWIRRSK